MLSPQTIYAPFRPRFLTPVVAGVRRADRATLSGVVGRQQRGHG